MNRAIAVVGCGYWGKNLVRNIHELGSLRTICDANAEKLAAIAAQYSGVGTTQNFDDVLADRDIAAVAIAVPAAMHYELAKKALLSGKDAFVEKPLALKAAEGDELVSR